MRVDTVYTSIYSVEMFLYEITSAFTDVGLKHAVVGGYALALHGIVRATIDVDVILSLRLEDFELAEKSLLKIGLQSRIPVRAQDIIKMRQEYIDHRNLIAWSFVDYKDPARKVDILINKDLRDIKVVKISVGGKKIVVAALEELLAMKLEAGRPQDMIDIQSIRTKIGEKSKKR